MINRLSVILITRYLSGPQVELFEGWQLDELLGAGTGDVGEGQTQVFQITKGARAQQAGKICVLHKERSTVRHNMSGSSGWLLIAIEYSYIKTMWPFGLQSLAVALSLRVCDGIT